MFRQEISPSFVWVAGAIFAAWVGNQLQSGVLLNHDVSWIAHSARWWLDGATFGAQILDPSPPMAWILSLPAAVLAELELMNEAAAVRLVFWTYFVFAAILLFFVSRHLDPKESAATIGWKLSFIVSATLTPAFSFGQREYLSVLLAMPYLACAAALLQGNSSVTIATRIAAGILAGLGFSIKPFFLAVPFLVEVLIVSRFGWRSILRPDAVAIGITVLAYGLGVLLLMPDYVLSIMPMIVSTYWAYETHSIAPLLERYLSAIEPALFGVSIAAVSRSWTHQHSVILLATAGYSISYFAQSKGFVYHAYPVLLCSLVFLGIALGSGLHRLLIVQSSVHRLLRILSATILSFLALLPVKHVHDDVVRWYLTHNVTSGNFGRLRVAAVDLVNRLAPDRGSHFFAFSTHPFPGFPTASYTKAEWTGRAASQFLVPAYARLDEVADNALRQRIISAANSQRRMVIEDFERHPPKVVFVERTQIRLGLGGRRFDDLAFYLADPAFDRIWSQYEELAPLGPLRVFSLKEN